MYSSKKSNDIMQKRIPKNPKYDKVESTIDTGASLSRYLKKIEDIKQNYRIRKDELFKRMKVTTFAQLVLQVAEINSHLYCNPDKSAGADGDERRGSMNEYESQDGEDTVRSTTSTATQRSTFQGVISGVGELDVNNDKSSVTNSVLGKGDFEDNVEIDDMPYLLLDVRDRDEYDQFHIIKSMSYPSAMISRSVNFETKEMLACRNKPGRIIIIYDEDERIAPRVADTLIQRGYDNLFLLSGGIKVAYKSFPKGLITGTVSESLRQAVNPNGKIKQRPHKSADVTSNDNSQRSVKSNMSTTSISSEIKSEFTMEDLAHLSLTLDASMDAQSSVGSSIYSRHTKNSENRQNVGSSLSITSSQVDHKKPFKC